jgi:hypothetical protein
LRKIKKKRKHLTTKIRKKCKPKIDHPKLHYGDLQFLHGISPLVWLLFFKGLYAFKLTKNQLPYTF